MKKAAVQVIKNQGDYESALSRLTALMDQNFSAASAAEAELELLAVVIEAYERAKVAPVFPDPVEAILFRLDQKNMKPKDLVPLIGSISKVSEVLARKRPLSLAMIRALNKGLGIPAEVLIASSGASAVDLDREPQYNFSKSLIAEMLKRGCFPDFRGNIAKLKEYAEEQICTFMYGMDSRSTARARLRAPLHQNGSRKMDDDALLVWHVCVLKKARRQVLTAKYRKSTITDEWLRDLAKLSRFDSGPRLAQEYLADAGIHLVIERHFKMTYLDGAAMLDDGKPIVALTLRHDRVDNFWFALLHELVHVKRHLSAERGFIADNLEDKTRSGQEEDEADEGAREALIPIKDWASCKVRTTSRQEDALDLANKLRIHPAIVAGRVRYTTGNWRVLNNLNGAPGQIRRHFEDHLVGANQDS